MAAEGQQHPLKIYYIMWIALFVLSGFSYATDFMDRGLLRHLLILLFMFLKRAASSGYSCTWDGSGLH